MAIPDKYIKKFPKLAYPLCVREGKYGAYTCGYCSTARAIANEGSHMRFSLNGQAPMPREDAIAYNLAACKRRFDAMAEAGNRTVVKEIRRDGQRILKPGANIYAQLKRKKGTAKSAGFIVECYGNDEIKININESTHIIPADEFVTGRKGTTEVSA